MIGKACSVQLKAPYWVNDIDKKLLELCSAR